MREVKNDGQPTPLNAPILKRRTACDGEFNTYAGERDDTAGKAEERRRWEQKEAVAAV